MKKVMILLVVIGITLVLLGGGLFVGGMIKLDWDFSQFDITNCERETTEFDTDGIHSLYVDVSTSNVEIYNTYGSKIVVEHFTVTDKSGDLVRKVTPFVREDGTLVCEESRNDSPFSMFMFDDDDKVIIRIPQSLSLHANIHTSTGNIIIGENAEDAIVMKDITFEMSTGNCIIYAPLTCNTLSGKASTGSLIFNGFVVSYGDVEFEASTGGVRFDKTVIAQDIKIKLSTGSVICTEEIMFDSIDIETSTGDVSLRPFGSIYD